MIGSKSTICNDDVGPAAAGAAPAVSDSNTTANIRNKAMGRCLLFLGIFFMGTSMVTYWRKDLRSITIMLAHSCGRHRHGAFSTKQDTTTSSSHCASAPAPTKTVSAAVAAHHHQQQQQQQQQTQNITTITSTITGRRRKPSFVIHVGPSKTATTTMQEDLAEMASLGNLDPDKYAYLGRVRQVYEESVVQRNMFDRKCLKSMKRARAKQNATASAYETVPCWKAVVQEIHSFRNKNTSIIISSEYISNSDSIVFRKDLFATLIDALKVTLADDWNPFVVVGFRRYAEWSISAVHQYHRLYCATLWKKDAWKYGDCESAWELTKQWMQLTPHPVADHYHYTDEAYQIWKKHFRVKILNFHREGHISAKFACNMLPDAPYLCNFFKNRPEMPRSNSIPSARGGYSTIIYAAYQKGLIAKTEERYVVLRKMEKYFDHEFGRDIAYADLPLRDCPNKDELQELLNFSLAMEQKLVPSYFDSPEGEPEHRNAFWKMVDVKREFCAVDTEAALEGKTTWQQVLESLVSRAKERQEPQP